MPVCLAHCCCPVIQHACAPTPNSTAGQHRTSLCLLCMQTPFTASRCGLCHDPAHYVASQPTTVRLCAACQCLPAPPFHVFPHQNTQKLLSMIAKSVNEVPAYRPSAGELLKEITGEACAPEAPEVINADQPLTLQRLQSTGELFCPLSPGFPLHPTPIGFPTAHCASLGYIVSQII